MKEHHTGDYHKAFSSANYIEWFKSYLLPNLLEPSLIILDKASYYKTKPIGTPNVSKLKKEDVLSFLKKESVVHDSNISCLEAKIRMKNWIQNSIELEIIQLADENGHEVLFTPPHHSDLQPIELVWAKIKSSIDRQYSKGVERNTRGIQSQRVTTSNV